MNCTFSSLHYYPFFASFHSLENQGFYHSQFLMIFLWWWWLSRGHTHEFHIIVKFRRIASGWCWNIKKDESTLRPEFPVEEHIKTIFFLVYLVPIEKGDFHPVNRDERISSCIHNMLILFIISCSCSLSCYIPSSSCCYPIAIFYEHKNGNEIRYSTTTDDDDDEVWWSDFISTIFFSSFHGTCFYF